MRVILAGLGGGTLDTLTMQAQRALEEAEVILGARRLLDALPETCTPRRIAAVTAQEIIDHLQTLNCEQAAAVFSGDSGFYSGARRLLPLLEENGFEAETLPGLSCVQLLSARLGRPWQDWRLVSAHGVDCDAAAEVMGDKPVFFLTGGTRGPAELCGQLVEAGLDALSVTVGENLSCPDEAIIRGTAGELSGRTFSSLSVLLAESAPSMPRRSPGWPDDWFIRGQTPMTKRFVRAAALSKLTVTPRDVCWDVGAGTGSVGVELSALCRRVYAVERDKGACGLISQNREKFHAYNLHLIEGRAPAALEALPAPDAVFVGGSGGELAAIIASALGKNPRVRLCVSAIALETLHAAVAALTAHGIEADVTQIAVSRTKAAGKLHLLTAGNPVFLIAGNCP